MKRCLFLILILLSIDCFSQCHLIAKWGIYDTRYLSISRERAISFLNFFKKDTRMTFDEAKEYSGTIGIPIETVMVNLGFSYTESGYKQFIESVSRMTTYDEIFIEKIVNVSRTVNKDIIKALEDCYNANGIHARIENTADDSLSFIVLKFKWDGGHSPVPLQLTVSDRNGLKLNGQKLTSSKKNITIGADEEIRISVTRPLNKSYAFTLRVLKQVPNATVLIRDQGLTLFKQKNLSGVPTRVFKVAKVSLLDLPRTTTAKWHGGGDEELKRFNTTELSGNFYLGIDGNKLTGNILATIREVISDYTTFEIRNTYTLFEAPQGWRIAGYGVEMEPYGSSTTILGPMRQGDWVSTPQYTQGPVKFFTWQGDSGRDQDQLEGCWIKCTLKDIVILMEQL